MFAVLERRLLEMRAQFLPEELQAFAERQISRRFPLLPKIVGDCLMKCLPKACADVLGSFRSRRYLNIHFASQFKNCETWLGERTSAAATGRAASWSPFMGDLLPGPVNTQPDLTQIFAGELELHSTGRCIPFRTGCQINGG